LTMMDSDRIETLLTELADRTAESASAELGEQITSQIPGSLMPHHHEKRHTISIMVDLRIGKLTAAGIVVASMLVLAAVFGSRSGSTGLYEDAKFLAGYLFKKAAGEQAAAESLRQYLQEKGQQVVYYGKRESAEPNSILLYWKLGPNRYKVVFCDFREKEVTAEQLIQLQSEMLLPGRR